MPPQSRDFQAILAFGTNSPGTFPRLFIPRVWDRFIFPRYLPPTTYHLPHLPSRFRLQKAPGTLPCFCRIAFTWFAPARRRIHGAMDNADPASEDPGDGRRAKRKRVALACEPCRDRKVKCDGAKPTCKVCEKRPEPRIPCVYSLVPQTAKQLSEQEYVLLPLPSSHLLRFIVKAQDVFSWTAVADDAT
jgi:hypothetical protein